MLSAAVVPFMMELSKKKKKVTKSVVITEAAFFFPVPVFSVLCALPCLGCWGCRRGQAQFCPAGMHTAVGEITRVSQIAENYDKSYEGNKVADKDIGYIN